MAVKSTLDVKPKSDPITLPGTKKEFIALVMSALNSSLPSLSIQTKAMIIAHAAYESGWGKARAAQQANLFNLTAGSSWAGAVVTGPDDEYDAAGNKRPITQRFRAYHSLSEGLRDYQDFLNRYHTRAANLLTIGDVAFVVALSQSHYYTLPVAQYVKTYRAVLNGVIDTLRAELGVSFADPLNL